MKSETAQSFLTFCKINFWTHWCYKESLPKLKLPFSVDVVNLMSKSSASVIVHDISKSHVQWTLFMVHLVNILMYESYREKSQNGTITIYIELPRKTSNENIVLEKSYLCEKWAVSIFSTFDVCISDGFEVGRKSFTRQGISMFILFCRTRFIISDSVAFVLFKDNCKALMIVWLWLCVHSNWRNLWFAAIFKRNYTPL